MTATEPAGRSGGPRRGLRLLDLGGLIAGFGLASLLARTAWPRSMALAWPAVVAFSLEFAWLGLAMSGPIILGCDPRRASARSGRVRPAQPPRPGRRIGEVLVIARRPPAAPPDAVATEADGFSRAELAWLGIGGYWIALTILVVPARAGEAPWTLAGLVPIVGALAALIALPGRPRPAAAPARPGWTHHAAIGLLWSWPLAWLLLILLGRTL